MPSDRMSRHTSHEVVVIGAGPAGLVAAITLAKYGVECLVVERRAESSSLPRATGVSLRTMELLRSWDLEHAARAGGNDVELLLLECQTLAEAASGTEHAAGFPTSAQSAVVSPTTPGCIPQDHLEFVLREHLRSLPRARLVVGFELTDIATSADGSRLTLRDIVSDEARTIEARYVIAADGASSAVRHALGIGMVGDDHLDERIVFQFRAPLWDLVGVRRYVLYSITHPQAVGSLLPAGGDDRWLYGVAWDPARERLADYTDDRVRDMIATATGLPSLLPRVERANAFSFAAQIADRFRHDDVFLVGDAAHRISPRGATGMNSAIADAFDIGWKLAWVAKGWARPALLGSYEPERRPLVEHNLARSADPMGSLRPVISELSVDLAGRIAHRWIPSPDGPISTLDLIGPGATLLTGPHSATWDRAVADVHVPVPVTVGRLDVVTARAQGIAPGGALLVRPDGFPIAAWNTPDESTRNLHEALASVRVDDAYRVRAQASRWVRSHSPKASLVSGRAK